MTKCKTCGGKMEMHYVSFCPKCDKPADKIVRILDAYRTAYYIAAQEGYDYSDDYKKNWLRKVLNHMEFPCNDSTIDFGWEDDCEEEYEPELWQYCQGLKKYFGVNGEEGVMLNISW